MRFVNGFVNVDPRSGRIVGAPVDSHALVLRRLGRDVGGYK
jgi:hypothetical protein